MKTKTIKILVAGRITDNDMKSIKAGDKYCEAIPGQAVTHLSCPIPGGYVNPCDYTPCSTNYSPPSSPVYLDNGYCEAIPGQSIKHISPPFA